MSVLAGLFLIAHGWVHVAVWAAPQPPDMPFDARHSWLLGDIPAAARIAAIASCALFVLSGILVIADTGPGPGLAIAGAVLSLILVALTFNRWLAFAVVINAAIIVTAAG